MGCLRLCTSPTPSLTSRVQGRSERDLAKIPNRLSKVLGRGWGELEQIEMGKRHHIFECEIIDIIFRMRQSGALAKYSAAETADVRLVRFSTFTKEELVV